MSNNVINAQICVDVNNVSIKICKIKYYENGSGDFFYIFTPYYDVINTLDKHIFQGIQGIDLSLKKKEYVRKNIVPCFILERSPSERRNNLKKLVTDIDIKNYKRLEWLKSTNLRYFGDNLYIV